MNVWRHAAFISSSQVMSRKRIDFFKFNLSRTNSLSLFNLRS
jgi:hypothetical protein